MDTFDLIDAIVTRPAAAGMILPHPFFLARAQEGGGGERKPKFLHLLGFFAFLENLYFLYFFALHLSLAIFDFYWDFFRINKNNK